MGAPDLPARIRPVCMKNSLRNIQPNRANLCHGRVLLVVFNTSTVAHRCRQGASTPSAVMSWTDPRSRKLPRGFAPLLENCCRSGIDPLVDIASIVALDLARLINRDQLVRLRLRCDMKHHGSLEFDIGVKRTVPGEP